VPVGRGPLQQRALGRGVGRLVNDLDGRKGGIVQADKRDGLIDIFGSAHLRGFAFHPTVVDRDCQRVVVRTFDQPAGEHQLQLKFGVSLEHVVEVGQVSELDVERAGDLVKRLVDRLFDQPGITEKDPFEVQVVGDPQRRNGTHRSDVDRVLFDNPVRIGEDDRRGIGRGGESGGVQLLFGDEVGGHHQKPVSPLILQEITYSEVKVGHIPSLDVSPYLKEYLELNLFYGQKLAPL